ncbi:hypothetical protein EDC14_104920 [Hydrogenispora ethanolica]|uniref:Uncharacterized protein n=1 Tax=Hydrogenispora ethanolica TaxID=1082276 RepID=A0A4R1QRK4_HYDET|nr:hypothetical protein [Hydrogenispora ethanolica]TCL56496.1 hypothetical protein EDC14_104920 [Hydrogenispora ethanolica]
MTLIELYKNAYHQLHTQTPLRTDCGRLCNRACCQENDEDLGMYLFPGEAELLLAADFLRIEPTDLQYLPGKNVYFASCNSQCRRSQRPLACRIFPLTPYMTAKGLLTTIIDPRARFVCPLAREYQRSDFHPEFVRAVQKVGQLLIKHQETQAFLLWLAAVIDEYRELPFSTK